MNESVLKGHRYDLFRKEVDAEKGNLRKYYKDPCKKIKPSLSPEKMVPTRKRQYGSIATLEADPGYDPDPGPPLNYLSHTQGQDQSYNTIMMLGKGGKITTQGTSNQELSGYQTGPNHKIDTYYEMMVRARGTDPSLVSPQKCDTGQKTSVFNNFDSPKEDADG
jgi:hypothetical protein